MDDPLIQSQWQQYSRHLVCNHIEKLLDRNMGPKLQSSDTPTYAKKAPQIARKSDLKVHPEHEA